LAPLPTTWSTFPTYHFCILLQFSKSRLWKSRSFPPDLSDFPPANMQALARYRSSLIF
jgi:hypothetical protein